MLIQTYPVPRAAYELFLRQATGRLDVQAPIGNETVWFSKGFPVAIQTAKGDIPLLDVATEMGLVSPEKAQSLQGSTACTPPCRCLLESGQIPPDRVTVLLRETLLREFGRCCLSVNPPTFTEADLPEGLESVQLNPFAAFFHFFAYFSTPDQIRESEAHYQQFLSRPNRNLQYMLPAMELAPHILQSLKNWENPRTLSDLYVVSSMNQRETLGVLALLDLTGTLELTPRLTRPAAGAAGTDEKAGSSPGTPPRPATATRTSQPATRTDAAASALTPMQQETLDALRTLREKVKTNNPFEILDVPRDASDADIKRAYGKLARLCHPDRLMGSPRADVVPLAEKIFAMIGNAFQTLSDKSLRQEVEKSLDDPEIRGDLKKLDMKKRAALEVEKTRVLFRKGDYRSALASARRALNLYPYDAATLAILAYCTYHTAPDRDSAMPKATELVVRAIEINPGSEHAHYYRGLLARLAGDLSTARTSFETVLSLNPAHAEARQQLTSLDRK